MMAGLFTLVLLLRYSIEKCSNYSAKECQCVLNKCLKNLTKYWKITFFINWHPSQRDWWSSLSFHATKRGLSSNRAARRFEPLGSSGICAFTLLNTNKTRSFFSTCSLWNLEGLGGSGSHFWIFIAVELMCFLQPGKWWRSIGGKRRTRRWRWWWWRWWLWWRWRCSR